MLSGKAPVEFVKGETYKYEVQFDENNYQNITSVHISSKELNFCHELEKDMQDPKKWSYLFTSSETKNFKPILTTYSLTAHNSIPELDPQILPNERFEVKRNENPYCLGE